MTPILYLWRTAAFILGTIFIFTGLISIIYYWTEKGRLRLARTRAIRNIPQENKKETVHRAALITGASSGLGAEYARRIDANPETYNVNELWLLARREDRLEKLASELRLPCRILSMDMTDKQALEDLKKTCKELNSSSDFTITMLVNCAGFGKSGNSTDAGAENEAAMVRLNDEAAVNITQLCIPYMKAGSRIAELCSVAGFQPIPGINAYAASKAFLYSYSRALRIELIRTGISVTAVCPYWVRDTEFISVATGERKNPFLSKTAEGVVSLSLSDIRRRHAVSTPGLVTTLDRFFRGLISDSLLARICGLFSLK
ncbi:MAG: SDR family NAD(P)-dependent oxidoreductase [Eubacterium sp.]|jgi:short-subunit dehydrogenase|nr:SDR family NAD(P)-dependent oxidoreductase [Eubacterium sp.]MCH4046317.1 SDR family NAD(P)-dependent oxidoreductase [Eubacterium sp.]MCH4079412.1 SDR family NAD(P)-dependent oxidoreductase [Eubacterium sp.]MCH4111038.1 SDR family NAD(P)-dependent oxidoreductase [Eubacterium sp.]MCI1307138.1 SDR family NAD(P)-dependent oxidoreductase [Eubacterium sp.]